MGSKRKGGMTDDQLSAMCRQEIDDASGYDESELSLRRKKAMDYYDGRMPDVPARKGRSQVTSHDLSDAIGWILPGLMRVFASGDRVADYEPSGPEDEEVARQATDYVNYVFMQECDGYRVLHDACLEALKLGNGIGKVYWSETPVYAVQDVRGLTDEAWLYLASADDVDVIQHSEEQVVEMMTDPTTGEAVQVETVIHNARIRRKSANGCLKVECLPPEEFLIQRHAKSLDDATFIAHRRDISRADLIAMGYDRDTVMGLGSDSDVESTDEYLARWDRQTTGTKRHESNDPMMEEVEVFECYIKADYDGDDWPEWRKVVLAGAGSDKDMLANDEWTDPVPFFDLCAMIVPHRWEGRSLLDELEDVQRVKTVLMRQTLDNIYLTNQPQRVVMENGVVNMDEVLNPSVGGVIIEKMPGAVRSEAIEFTAAQSFQMLSYLDDVSERRTGVSRTSMALDPDALQNQTAQGAMIAQSASYAKIELYARNISLGLRKLFRVMLRLLVAHQDKPKVIRLRNKWVEMDPRAWNAEMDVTVNVGLGSGSRDRDIQMLMQILAQQKEVMMTAGPFNPIAGIDKVVNTARKIVEVAGIRNADAYFAELSQEEAQAWYAENMAGDQGPSEKEKIEMLKAESTMQIEQMKAQLQAEVERVKAEGAAAKEAAQMQADLEVKKAEMEVQERQAFMQQQFEAQKLAVQTQLEREKMAQQRQIELLKLGMQGREVDPETGEAKPHVFDEMKGDLSSLIGQSSADQAAMLAQQVNQALQQQTALIMKLVTAPKRVVRDPATGKAMGVETILN